MNTGDFTKEDVSMKKTIRKREYDTETATVVKKCCVSYYGDPAGYEQILFRTPEGLYFEYCFGGPQSPYAIQIINCVAKTKVSAWLNAH